MTRSSMSVAISSVASAWQAGGRRAPMPASPASSANCSMPDCALMTFVELKTRTGLSSLCFTHFESVKADLGA
jgi:hypothetical protein